MLLPCLNPSTGWETTLEEKIKTIQHHFKNLKIITVLIDDGSENDLMESLNHLKTKIPSFEFYRLNRNHGKGYSLRHAIRMKKADYYMFTDIDFPYELNSMIKMIDHLVNQNLDACLGVRSQTYYEKIPKIRRWISKILRWGNRVVFPLITNDTQCGLKSFNAPTAEEIFLSTGSNRYLFDLEFVILLSKLPDRKISLINVDLRDEVNLSEPKILPIAREFVTYLKLIFRNV